MKVKRKIAISSVAAALISLSFVAIFVHLNSSANFKMEHFFTNDVEAEIHDENEGAQNKELQDNLESFYVSSHFADDSDEQNFDADVQLSVVSSNDEESSKQQNATSKNASKSKSDNRFSAKSNNTNNVATPSCNTTRETSNSSKQETNKSKKVWVEPEYRIVHHNAEYRTVNEIVGYKCQCGAEFDTHEQWHAHRPNP